MMKTAILLSSLFGFFGACFAQISPTEKLQALSHLVEINAEWNNHQDAAPTEIFSFETDIDRISEHIALVTEDLRSKTPNSLNASQLSARTELLNALEQYGRDKVFPTNSMHSERTPYFIDDYGVYCAVGFLFKTSGHNDLAMRIHDEHNFDYIKDISTPGVDKWATDHGFTESELAWIQPGYPTPGAYVTVGGGTNGAVNAMCSDSNSDRIFIVGNFTELAQGNLCGNVAYIENDAVYCLGSGVTGDLNDVFMFNDNVVVTGQIENMGTAYSYGVFNSTNSTWSYFNIPTREGMPTRTGIFGNGAFDLQMVIPNDLGNNEHEIWTVVNGAWNHVATAFGTVNSIAKSGSELAYAGEFQQFTAHTFAGDLNFTTENAILNETGTDNWFTLSGQIADEVHKVKWLNGNFFFAGRALWNQSGITNSFSTIHADTIAAIYAEQIYAQNVNLDMTIYDFDALGDSSVVVCGEFTAGWMQIGDGVASIDYAHYLTNIDLGYPWSGSMAQAIGSIYGEIPTSIKARQTEIYVGGDLPTRKNAVKFDATAELPSSDKTSISIYPNPVENNLYLKSSMPISAYKVFDFRGQVVLSGDGDHMIVSNLSEGAYLILVSLENGELIRAKFVKN